MEFLILILLIFVGVLYFSNAVDFLLSPILDKLADIFGLRRKESTFEENYKNKVAIVTEKISGWDLGRVTLEGVTWNAKAEDKTSEFIKGEQVIVLGVDGNQLTVIRKN